MAKSETGHGINVANFETLISYCTGYGQQYNPSNADITLAALTALHAKAKAALATVTQTERDAATASNNRRIVFTPLKKLSTKMVNALAASGVAKETLADAKSINGKIQGERLTDKPEAGEDGKTPKSNSSSRQSFDSMIEHFEDFAALLAGEPKYKPNETDVQVATIQQLITDLKTVNTSSKDAETAWSNSRIARNDALYTPVSGLYDKAMEVKSYVKSVYGASSPQFKQVSKIKFKQIPE